MEKYLFKPTQKSKKAKEVIEEEIKQFSTPYTLVVLNKDTATIALEGVASSISVDGGQ